MKRAIAEQAQSRERGNPDPDDEDLKLIELVRAGDRIAFDRIVLKYRDRIVSLCARVLGDSREGEDAAQETFVKVYGNIGRFKGESRFSTWLYRIAVNTCRNFGRSWWDRLWRTAYRLDTTVIADNGEERRRELEDTSMLPTKDLERKRRAAVIREAIGKLPVNHRELVILRDIQEQSYDEIARITGLPEGTVKSRLARAREALRNDLKGLQYE